MPESFELAIFVCGDTTYLTLTALTFGESKCQCGRSIAFSSP